MDVCVLSCHALTFTASREKKNSFFATAIPSDKSYTVLDDFNAQACARGLDDE